MLSIGKLTVEQSRYYERQVAQGRDDYYSGRGESPGRWTGSGAETLGLGGRVDDDGFMALMDGRDPGTGERLKRVGGRSKVAAFDLTFSAPKSVSVLFAIGERALAGALVEAHESAVDAALGYLEREACRVRRGRGGVRREVGEGFVAAAYRHRMSRAEDPQLHTHVVAANMARGATGAGRRLMPPRSTSTPRRPASSTRRTCARRSASGCRGCAGGRCATGWPRSSSYRRRCCGSSPRVVVRSRSASASSWRRASRLGMAGVRRSRTTRAGASATGSTPRRGVTSCAPGRPSTASVRASSPRSCLDRRGRPSSGRARVSAELAGAAGLTEKQNTFARREAVMAWAAAHGQGAPAHAVERAARGVPRARRRAPCARSHRPAVHDERSARPRARDRAGAQARRGEGTGRLDRALVDAVLANAPFAPTASRRP